MLKSRVVPFVVLAVLVVVFTFLNVALSLRSGDLSVSSPYDDCIYLLDAYQRVAFGHVDTLAKGAASFLADPPHAPMSTVTAMIGYAVFGTNLWGPYVANIWILAAFAAVVYSIARSRLSALPSVMLTTFMMFAPAAHAMISSFRPDTGAGLIFGFALYLLLSTSYAVAATRRLVFVGFIAAAAVIAKPSACVVVIPMLGLAGLVGFVRPGQKPIRACLSALPGVSIAAFTALVILIPAIYVFGRQTLDYVYETLITDRALWATPGNRLFHWTYHAWGPGGSEALGPFLNLGLLVLAVDMLRSARQWRETSNYEALSLYLILVIIYCGMATADSKSIFQGSFFYLPFLLAVTLAIARILGAAGRPWLCYFGTAALLCYAVIFLRAATFYGVEFIADRYVIDTMAMQNAVAAIVVDQVESDRARGCKIALPIYASIAPDPLAPEAVALTVALTRNIRIDPQNIYDARSASELIDQAKAAHFVLIPNKWALERSGSWDPSVKFTTETMAALGADASWRKVVLPGADPVVLFARKAC